MEKQRFSARNGLLATLIASAPFTAAQADVQVQCPGDSDGDAAWNSAGEVRPAPNVKCMHLAAGDGFAAMADGKVLYTFGFSDMTGVARDEVMHMSMLAASMPGPTIALEEGDQFYLSLTNVGMVRRPDLFDPHTVHFHGFPNAASVFDGEPEASVSVNMGSTFTYYYNIVEPGTYMYHCHVEAAEHMQMGMLGNLYVHPAQDGTAFEYPAGSGRTYTRFVYNDGDGSTGYDAEFALQLGSFDPVFHDEHLAVQPLPFAAMRDTYAYINGRGYPDSVNPNPLPTPIDPDTGESATNGVEPQTMSALITANAGERILLRISNLSITNYYTITALGLPMKVVGTGARILRGPTGRTLYYDTSSVDIGGGEAFDVLIDTAGVAPGTYFLYTTNLQFLSNDREDYGGMMTEIVIAGGAP